MCNYKWKNIHLWRWLYVNLKNLAKVTTITSYINYYLFFIYLQRYLREAAMMWRFCKKHEMHYTFISLPMRATMTMPSSVTLLIIYKFAGLQRHVPQFLRYSQKHLTIAILTTFFTKTNFVISISAQLAVLSAQVSLKNDSSEPN